MAPINILFGYRCRALWTDLAHKPNRVHGINWSTDVTPSLGERQSTRIEIPAFDIGTGIDWTVLIGGVDLGLNIGMDGDARLAFTPHCGRQPFQVSTIQIDGTEGIHRNYELTPLRLPGTVAYGFTIDNLRYQMAFTLTPQLKGWARVGYKDFSRSFSTGWISFSFLETDLGSVSLGPHAGTRQSYEFMGGSKQFRLP